MNILFVATNVSHYPNCETKTGLWLSEFTHFFDLAKQANCTITLASPLGGEIPIDPESLKAFLLDSISKKYLENTEFKALLENSKSLEQVQESDFDVVYLTGGHGTMFDFPSNETLQKIIAKHWQQNKKIAAICHGVGGLLNVKIDNGDFLIKDKKLTGFNWAEELIANRRKLVPFNLEAELKKRTHNYQKSWLPMTSKVVVDGNLITGQNPFSSKEMAEVLKKELKL
ncbi:type 1 glutamine amidotransferase domain-containing protein [Ornithobacterium rhinotracheale]|uniref:type 1 glutamine amidotransferase domain-containing protein n=1 Tax=Ornithobacterium rhinotracheale TaxID=28251 RepID=UPI00129CE156|nr:type 1 glutamine amidotransferase domain-containing protein [Ornithobacterium rhinotracheale]MRJ08456.1 type 1 glutamine amidotransferase domain-containing protein [Ornithobacterium rhinotracheale]MRJ10188.1 type 1 glutamine amidotransferase domain-containing protein [Ornithobacterium rhinotracheale]UOH76731.1 type 1 glutamine amidotransferase domain-containing protein [Ornithobacterium rhinotracheale]